MMSELRDAIWQFPRFALGIVIGIVIALLTRVEVFLFVVFGVLVGIAAGPATGVAIAFGMYTFFYVISQYIQLGNSNFNRYLSVINRAESGVERIERRGTHERVERDSNQSEG